MELNDDCLTLIFSLLDLKDQISAAKVCWRFRDVLSSLWQRTYREFSVYESISPDTLDELAILMETICGTVQSMDLGSLTYDEFDVITLYTYPKVKRLVLCQPETDSDECILKMTEVFPNLRSFSPNSPEISGRHIENWRLLEHLNLYSCEKVKFSHIEKIMETVQLKSLHSNAFLGEKWSSMVAFKNFCNLESIHLCSRELVLLPNLSLFSNLKKIGLLDTNSNLVLKLIEYVACHKHNDLIELYACTSFPLDTLLIRTFANLKKISLLWGHASDYITISRYVPHLREIVLKKCYGLKKDDILLWLYSTEIELINIENCKCEFTDLSLNVKEIAKRRIVLLHFNFFENEFVDKKIILNVQGESGLLKVTSKQLAPDWYPKDCLLFS